MISRSNNLIHSRFQVFDACRIVREKIPESKLEDPKEYGLFLVDEDPKKGGVWLENSKTLGYYLLKTGVSLQLYGHLYIHCKATITHNLEEAYPLAVFSNNFQSNHYSMDHNH